MSGQAARVIRKDDDKIWFLEWLRVFACLAVVLIHCFAAYLDKCTVAEAGLGRALVWTEILVVFARWAVPAFFMITGTLLLDPARAIGLRKLFGYIKRVALILVIFGTGYALAQLVFDAHGFNLAMLPAAVCNMLSGKSWSHMWYLYDLLGIYLLLPLLRAFAANDDRRFYEMFLVALFVFACVVPTANDLFGLELKNVLWLGKSVFYVLLGRYLFAYVEISPRVAAAGILCLATNAILTGIGITAFGTYWSALSAPASPFIAGYSAALFLAAKKYCNAPMKRNGVGKAVNRLSFGIYLVHPVFVNLLYKMLDWPAVPLPPFVFEIATYLLVIVPSALLALMLTKVPGFRRLI